MTREALKKLNEKQMNCTVPVIYLHTAFERAKPFFFIHARYLSLPVYAVTNFLYPCAAPQHGLYS